MPSLQHHSYLPGKPNNSISRLVHLQASADSSGAIDWSPYPYRCTALLSARKYQSIFGQLSTFNCSNGESTGKSSTVSTNLSAIAFNDSTASLAALDVAHQFLHRLGQGQARPMYATHATINGNYL